MMGCMKRHADADLAADLAAIEGSVGALADQEAFSRARDECMGYLDRVSSSSE